MNFDGIHMSKSHDSPIIIHSPHKRDDIKKMIKKIASKNDLI